MGAWFHSFPVTTWTRLSSQFCLKQVNKGAAVGLFRINDGSKDQRVSVLLPSGPAPHSEPSSWFWAPVPLPLSLSGTWPGLVVPPSSSLLGCTTGDAATRFLPWTGHQEPGTCPPEALGVLLRGWCYHTLCRHPLDGEGPLTQPPSHPSLSCPQSPATGLLLQTLPLPEPLGREEGNLVSWRLQGPEAAGKRGAPAGKPRVGQPQGTFTSQASSLLALGSRLRWDHRD